MDWGRRSRGVRRLVLGIGGLLLLLGLLAAVLVVSRPPNTYFPYLGSTVEGAEERLRPFGFGCQWADGPDPIFATPLEQRASEITRRFSPPTEPFQIGTCESRFRFHIDVTFHGDDRAHIFEVRVWAFPDRVGLRAELVRVLAAASGPGFVERGVSDWLVRAAQEETYEGKRARFALDAGGSSVHITMTALDADDLPRILASIDQAGPPVDHQRLAKAFAPRLAFAHDEAFRPMGLDELNDVAELCPLGRPAECAPFDALPEAGNWYLDIPRVEENQPAAYAKIEADRQRKSRPVIYWHVAAIGNYRYIVQYWFYYLYNRFTNLHEGDWETVQLDVVRWRGAGLVVPLRWYFSSHEGGEVRSCEALQGDCLHPTVHVARGSHANYFESGDQIVVTQCTAGFCVRIPATKDLVPEDVAELETHDYDLIELSGAGFSGRYGKGNFYNTPAGLRLVPGSVTAPNDPRRRDEWSRNPLKTFATAPGDEPGKRSWSVVELGD